MATAVGAQEDKMTHIVVGVKTAVVSCPPKYNALKRYPVLMVVGSPRQTPMESMRVWQPIAADLGYILVCPASTLAQGDKVTDEDRQDLISIRNYMDRNYRIDAGTSILVGMGAGANLAVETALVYPRKFRNAIGFYGFFNTQLESLVRKYMAIGEYKYSALVLVTSDGDPSQNSYTRFSDMLDELGYVSELVVYPDMLQGYPRDLRGLMTRIRAKVAENAKKETLR